MISPSFLSKSEKTSQGRWHLGWALKDDQTLPHLQVGTVVDGILGWQEEAPHGDIPCQGVRVSYL